jgi:enhancer of polycomb-like protein
VRKLAKTTTQPVLREDQIDPSEYRGLKDIYTVDTGVEKNEEKEYHLQAALAASSGAADKDAENEIPAPPAQECKDIHYDALYSLKFQKPSSYIRFSQTVEECTGCQYNMTAEDDEFLKDFNQKRQGLPRLSEDEFERIMEIFEETAEIHTPFASVDGTVIPYQTMSSPISQQISDKTQGFAPEVYKYWKQRKLALGKVSLQPKLKFEINQEKDDGDPYVCFRRRDARQTRKTRGRDALSADKLKRLRKELEEGRNLISMALRREETKLRLLKINQEIFAQRAKVKEAKVRLGIKTDDEDLFNERPQKRRLPEFAQHPRPSGPPPRFPGRADGRPLDADLVLLSDILEQKENMLQAEIEEKAQQHSKWNIGHEDLTRDPLPPVNGPGAAVGFRTAVAQYQLMTPPASETSESFDHPSPQQEKQESLPGRSCSPPVEAEVQGHPAFRLRIGRLNRVFVDRRGMPRASTMINDTVSDRYKYDQDDDDEQPVYPMDPYDTKALRFRATIPLPSHLLPQRNRPDERMAQARAIGSSPANNRTVATAAHPPQAPT